MCAAAYFFGFISRADRKFNAAPANAGYHRFGFDTMPGRSYGKMLYVNLGSNRTFSGIEVGADGVESCIFHRQNHHRRSEHIWQNGVFELTREVPILDLHRENTARSGGYGTHEKPFVDGAMPPVKA